MSKKYIVFSGHVTSKNDGDRHFISSGELIHLYKVDPRECEIYTGEMTRREMKGLIPLHPDPTGRYLVPNDDKKLQ